MATTAEDASLSASVAQNVGVVRRAWRALFGWSAKLREREGHTSWLSYLLMVVQSMTLVLVAGSPELRTVLGNATLAEKALMTLSLGVLVFGTYASAMAAQRTMGRISPLLRNRRTLMAMEHVSYVAFVVLVEFATTAVALYVIATNPQALLSGDAVLPQALPVIVTMVGVRAVILAWTEIQLKIIAEPLPPNELTLMRHGVTMVGGHAAELMASMKLQARDVAAALNAVAEMSKPPRRIPHWYNGWLRRRDALVEREQDELRAKQIAALQSLTRDAVAEAQAEAARAIAEAKEEAQRLVAQAREQGERAAQWAREQAAAREQERHNDLLTALLHLTQHGEFPPAFVERYPELASVALTPARGGRSAPRHAIPAPKTRSQRVERFLQDLDIIPAKRPDGSKKVWVRSGDVGRLVRDGIAPDKLRALVRECGQLRGISMMDGTSLIAPVDALMDALMERHWASDSILQAWQEQVGNEAESSAA